MPPQGWVFQWFDRVGIDGNSVQGQEAYTTKLDMMADPFKVMFRTFSGGDSPPFRSIDEPVPLHPGSHLKFVDTMENEVDLTLLIRARTQYQLYRVMHGSKTDNKSLPLLFSPVHIDQIVTLNNPQNAKRTLTGNGRLRVRTPGTGTYKDNGITKQRYRDLICRCISGFNLVESKLNYHHAFSHLTFRANQPYWRGFPQQGFSITNGSLDQTWFRAMNVDMGSGDRFNKIINPQINGDVATYPIIRIHGPCSNPVVRNLSTGKKLKFENLVIGRLERLDIDCDRKTVRINGGGNKIRNMTFDSQFFTLIPGQNRINVRLQTHPEHGITIDTRADFLYYERFTGVY